MQRAPDAECSEDLISAIVHMCHVVGGPASGITREEAIAAATFKDELRTYKCAVSIGYAVPESGSWQQHQRSSAAQSASSAEVDTLPAQGQAVGRLYTCQRACCAMTERLPAVL